MKNIRPGIEQLAQVNALTIQRNMPHLAAHSLIDARQTQVTRVLDGVYLIRAKQLDQHRVKQLGARTDDDIVGIDIHAPRPAQMMSDRAPQPSGALRRCGREDFALIFGRQRRPQSTLPETCGFQGGRRKRGELFRLSIGVMNAKARRSSISVGILRSRSQNWGFGKLARVVATTRL